MVRAGRRLWMVPLIAVLLGAAACVAHAADPDERGQPLLPPVSPACVSSPFGPRVLKNRPLAGRFHGGIDLPARVGSAVSAVAPGRVIRIHRRGVGGLEMLIQHDGFIGVYSHLGLIASVLAEGAKSISRGEHIGTVGRSGLTYGSHLYFGMLVEGRPVDPAPYLGVDPCGAGKAAAQDTNGRPIQMPTPLREWRRPA
jgi:murein DD-endopeptidase MepM/ murein hydrolase activator NlpD